MCENSLLVVDDVFQGVTISSKTPVFTVNIYHISLEKITMMNQRGLQKTFFFLLYHKLHNSDKFKFWQQKNWDFYRENKCSIMTVMYLIRGEGV